MSEEGEGRVEEPPVAEEQTPEQGSQEPIAEENTSQMSEEGRVGLKSLRRLMNRLR